MKEESEIRDERNEEREEERTEETGEQLNNEGISGRESGEEIYSDRLSLLSEEEGGNGAEEKSLAEILNDSDTGAEGSGILRAEDFINAGKGAREYVKDYFKSQNIDFDINDPDQRDAVNQIRDLMISDIKERRLSERRISEMLGRAQAMYGKDFAAIDFAALDYINNELSYSKRKKALAEIRSGNEKVFRAIYEEAEKRVKGKGTKRPALFPPSSIGAGIGKPQKRKEIREEDII